MKNNNGKVAIAIVAMFVVALSVVGFTYAYFTAQVQGNDKEVSVDVGAGIMQVKYEHGTELAAKNIVPGWLSDTYHYYDPVVSSTTGADGVRQISAAVLEGTYENKTLPANSGLKATDLNVGGILDPANENSIVAAPVTLKVTNTGNQVAKYAINLKVTTIDGFSASDVKDYLNVYLVKGTWDQSVITHEALATKVTNKEAIKVNGLVVGKNVLDQYESIENENAFQNYYVVLEYAESGAKQDSMGGSFLAEVEIEGLGQESTEPTVGE